MSISVSCDECAAKYTVREDKAGTQFNCVKCSSVVKVPETDELEDDEIDWASIDEDMESAEVIEDVEYIRVKCTHCNEEYEVPETKVGKRIRCEICHGKYVVPEPKEIRKAAEPMFFEPHKSVFDQDRKLVKVRGVEAQAWERVRFGMYLMYRSLLYELLGRSILVIAFLVVLGFAILHGIADGMGASFILGILLYPAGMFVLKGSVKFLGELVEPWKLYVSMFVVASVTAFVLFGGAFGIVATLIGGVFIVLVAALVWFVGTCCCLSAPWIGFLRGSVIVMILLNVAMCTLFVLSRLLYNHWLLLVGVCFLGIYNCLVAAFLLMTGNRFNNQELKKGAMAYLITSAILWHALLKLVHKI